MDDAGPRDAISAPDPGPPDSLAALVHDLRQPLVVAVGYVSMLQDGAFGELSAEAQGVLRTVAERLDALNAMVDRLAEAG